MAKRRFSTLAIILLSANLSYAFDPNAVNPIKNFSSVTASILPQSPIEGEMLKLRIPNFYIGKGAIFTPTISVVDSEYGSVIDPADLNQIPNFDYITKTNITDEDARKWSMANIFFHINYVTSYVQNILNDTKPLPKVNVRLDNKYTDFYLFTPDLPIMIGGTAEFDSDVIYKEVFHRLLYSANKDAYLNRNTKDMTSESVNLIESYANYLALSLNNDSHFASYFHKAHEAGQFIFSYDNNCGLVDCDEFIVGIIPSHKYHMAFGGALWELRNEIGVTATDSLAYYSFRYISKTVPANIRDSLNAILIVDRLLFKSKYKDKILEAFKNHQIELTSSN